MYKYPLVYVRCVTNIPTRSKPVHTKIGLYNRRMSGIYHMLISNKCVVYGEYICSCNPEIYPTTLQIYVKVSKKSKPVLLVASDVITNKLELDAFVSSVVENHLWIKPPFLFNLTEICNNDIWKITEKWMHEIQNDSCFN